MEIKKRINKTRVPGVNVTEALYKGQWLTAQEIANHKDFEEKKFTHQVIYSRLKNDNITEWSELTADKRGNRGHGIGNRNSAPTALVRPMTIEHLGNHMECKEGEILIAYVTAPFFETLKYWSTQRLGEEPYNEDAYRSNVEFVDKYPMFIQKDEAYRKGWKIVPWVHYN
jgi:hypothetical protein